MTSKSLREISEAMTPGTLQRCGHDRGGCKCGLVWSVEADTVFARTSGDEEVKVSEALVKSNALGISIFCDEDVREEFVKWYEFEKGLRALPGDEKRPRTKVSDDLFAAITAALTRAQEKP